MVFNSFGFIFIFMPLLLAGYNLLLHFGYRRLAILFITAMSAVLYGMFNYKYLVIIGISMAITYLFSYIIEKKSGDSSKSIIIEKGSGDYSKSISIKKESGGSSNSISIKKKVSPLIPAVAVLFHVAVLGYFKYTGFLVDNINSIFKTDYTFTAFLLPVGISFYTFSQIAFVIDRYRGEIPHYDFLSYAFYILYFPKIMQGPIAFPKEIIDQTRDIESLRFDADRFGRGIILFIIGLAKKVLLADTIALIVTYTYSQAYYLDTLCVIVAGIATALNIYFDFSGYCDMADGISQMLGITLPQNFNSPFKASTVQELWQRWHMTLSRFLTKYIYFPLGGSRKGAARTIINILIIFFISGLWHGAGWTYVVWGLVNGILVIFDHFHKRKLLPIKIRQVLTFLFFSFSVIIFQASDLTTAGVMIGKLSFFTYPGFLYRTAANLTLSETYVLEEAVQLFAPNMLNIYYFILMMIVIAFSLFLMTRPNAREIAAKTTFKTWQIVALSVLACLSILSLSNVQTFVYFTF